MNIQKIIVVISFFALSILLPMNTFGDTIEWEDRGDAVDGYKLYYGIFDDSTLCSSHTKNEYSNVVDLKINQYVLDNLSSLSSGKQYCFAVSAYNSAGESDISEAVSWIPSSSSDNIPPLTPSGLSAEIMTSTQTDTTAPLVTIKTPTSGTTYETQSDSINLSGTSSDDTGIRSVTWSSSRGGSGTATGTDNWSVAGITLSDGENHITITARDSSGNTSTDTLVIIVPVVILKAPSNVRIVY
jgi:hypothetical protein